MAVMPGARWEPVTGHNGGRMRSYTGVVLHCNDAPSYDLHDFIQRSSGDSIVSCHFQVGYDGVIFQYVDTKVQAWCQGGGNADYISVESEGRANELATPAQVLSVGRILAWIHKTHGVALQLAERPGDKGFGWHGMGAKYGAQPPWGHSVCPGVRKDQRGLMLAAAHPVVLPPVPAKPPVKPPVVEDEMTPHTIVYTVDQTTVPKDVTWPGEWVLYPYAGKYVHISHTDDVKSILITGGGGFNGGRITYDQHLGFVKTFGAAA